MADLDIERVADAVAALPELRCEVCEDEPAAGAAAVPGVPITVAYGRRCLAANAHPWWVIVGNTAAINGLEHAAAWWVSMVEATMRHLGKTREDLDRDVARAKAEAEGAVARADGEDPR